MICPTHNKELKLVPAGVSKKTQQPYPAFYACPVYGCKSSHSAENPEKPEEIVYTDPEPTDAKPATGDMLVIEHLDAIEEEIKAVNERLDKMAEWMVANIK